MSAVNSTIGNEQPASDRLREQVHVATQDIQAIGVAARDATQEKFDRLQAEATDLYEHGRVKARQAARSLEQHVTEKPLQSILIAAAVGLLLGRFWTRR